MPSTTLSIRVDDADKLRLHRLAEAMGRSSSVVAAEAINAYLDLNEWQLGAIREGIASLDAGRGIPHADVRAWVESWEEAGDGLLPPHQ